MAVGRISGPLLKSNLIRNGIDLAFETDLLYLDVTNNRVGINTSSPQYDLDVNGTSRTTNLTVTGGSAEMAGMKFENNVLSSTNSTITLGTLDNVVYQKKLRVGEIDIDDNVIQTNTSNSNLELRPNGTGKVIVRSDMDVQGNIHATGNITADGNITLGDADTDDVIFQGEVASNIIPDADNTYALGSASKRWSQVNAVDVTAQTLTATNVISGDVDLTTTHDKMLYVAENGLDTNQGNHPQSPYATIKHALSQATAGDVVHVYAGEYTETFPLTVPAGVTLRGQSIRSVNIKPTVESEFNDAFLVNGESTIEELTVKDFYSGGKFFTVTDAGSSSAWPQQAKLVEGTRQADANFGVVAIDGDYAIVGAGQTSIDGNGEAYIFYYSGGSWTQQAILTASDGAADDGFGWAVSISGDTAVVGAYLDDDDGNGSGSAYVFTRSGSTWTEQQKLTASDAAATDLFGAYVAIENDTVVVGANRENSLEGAAYVFTRSGGTWTEQQKLTASDGASGDRFGSAVAISGETVVIGSREDNSDRGSAYVFTRSGGTWTQQQKLEASDGISNDKFGTAVDIDGDYIVVGANEENGDRGSAYVFKRSGSTWTQQQKLTGSAAISINDYFGTDVAISGSSIIVGSPGEDEDGLVSGAAYVFTRSVNTWTEQERIQSDDIGGGDQFGDYVGIDGDRAIVGSIRENGDRGAAYVFNRPGGTSNTTVNVGVTDQAHTYVSGGTITISGASYPITGAIYTESTGVLVVYHTGGLSTVGAEVFLKDLTFSCTETNQIFPNSGYAFRFATDFEVTSRSPYIRNITVLTKGKTTSGVDPRGFLSGDAGKGAYIDGAYATAASKEASMLFHSATFITPGVDAITMTNGVRVEWLNSFTYFADKSIYAFDSNAGIAYDGKTQLRVSGSPSVSAGETITYYDDDGVTVLATGTIESISNDKFFIDGKVTGFLEASQRGGKTLTANGDAQVSTAQKKFGSGSLLLDGTGDYVSLASTNDFGFVEGDFSVNFWVRLDAIGATAQNLFDMRAGSASDTAPRVYTTSGNIYYDVGGTAQITGNSALSATTWHHIAIDRSGTDTKLWVDGTQVGSTYTDNNDYGNIKPLIIGADYSGANAADGYIDDFRVVKGASIYQSTFTAPTSRHIVTAETVLMARFNGTNGATTFTDDVVYSQDIRFSGGATAESFTLVDYSDFGAEIRLIGSASVYGNYGLYGDGPGVVMYAIGQNLAYIGTGAEENNDPDYVIQANEVTSLNGARVRYNSIDHKGDFRVGDLFYVNQDDGTVTFTSANFNINTNSGLTFSTGGSNTVITGDRVDTGNLRLSGNTISSTSGNIIFDASNDEIEFTDDVNITGSLDVSGDVTIGGNITFGDSSNDSIQFVAGIDSDLIPSTHNTFSLGTSTDTWSNLYVSRMYLDDFEIDTNVIQTTVSNADLELRANGTGRINVPSNNVQIDNDLNVDGTTTLANTTINGDLTVTGNSTQTGDITVTGNVTVSQDLGVDEVAQFEEIKIEDNVITTTSSNADLELRASGTGRVVIPANDVIVSQNLTITGDLTVNAASGASGAITASQFTTAGILIQDNFITTTESNADLEFRTSGTGDVVFDDIRINYTTIETDTGDLTLAPDDGNVNINSTGALKLPVGTTAQRPTAASGQIRYNSETSAFEGYNGSNWQKLSGLEDLDGDTKITAELTPGANDDTIRFIIANNTVADLTSTRLQVPKLAVDDIEIDGNRISTVTTDTDLELDAQGTGQVKFANFGFSANQITNTVADSVTEFRNTNNGYVKFDGTYGFVLPVGDNTNKPGAAYRETGMIRWNTADARVEVFDGTSWVSVAGTSGGISFADAEDLAISLAISLG